MRPSRGPPVLVDDLIPIILGCDDHWWPRDYQRLALISPAWVEPVRKRLYAHPSLRTFPTITLFAQTLLHNPALLPYLWGLDIRPVTDGRRTLDEHEMRSLRYVLGLKGLKSVTLGGDLAVSAERFLQFMADTHTITSLHIDGSSCMTGPVSSAVRDLPSLEWDDSMVVRFRCLRTLTLSNLALTVDSPSIIIPGELSRLTLNNVEILDGFLDDICQGSAGRLRILDVVGIATPEMDAQVRSVMEICEQLEELRYEAVDTPNHLSIFDGDEEILTCPNLRNLRVAGFAVSPLTLQAIAQSCPKLVDLSILGRVARLPHEEWASFIDSGALPCLRRLTYPAGTNKPPFMFWTDHEEDMLRRACRAQQIDFVNETFIGDCLCE